LDAASLTALRTGAVSGLATDLLARPDAQNVTIFGAGVQGRTQLVAVSSVRPIRQVTVYDLDSAVARRFADQMSAELQVPVTVATSSTDAVDKADIICTATVATKPVFLDRDLPPGVHINAVGSYQPNVQEVPTETVQRARIVLDHRASALAETGDLIIPLAAGVVTRDDLDAELGDVVTGKTVGRRAADEVTLFKSVGLAVQDLVAAHVALTSAERLGLGTVVSL
jgi:alanine dehydrogenase